jgi:hypothetical protein
MVAIAAVIGVASAVSRNWIGVGAALALAAIMIFRIVRDGKRPDA